MKDLLLRLRRHSLSARDQRLAEPNPEQLQVLPPSSFADVTGYGVPPRIDLKYYEDTYYRLGNAPITLFKKGDEYTVVGPAIKPLDLVALLGFPSPDKFVVPTIRETVEHWDEMMGDTRLREGHRKHIPGWREFEKSGSSAIEFLRRNSSGEPTWKPDKHSQETLIPVFRWKTDTSGNRTLILSPLSEDEKQDLVRTLPGQDITTAQLNESVGLTYLAGYSPSITILWESDKPYHPRHDHLLREDRPVPSQATDFIQTLAFVYRMVAAKQLDARFLPDAQDLQSSPLLSYLEAYAEKGVVPAYDPRVAIRKQVLDFFTGRDLTRRQHYSLPTEGGTEIYICADGQPNIHKAEKYHTGLKVSLFQEPDGSDGIIQTRYVLQKYKDEKEIQLTLTDYKDGRTQIHAVSRERISGVYYDWNPFDLNTPDGKQRIQDTFGIKLP